MTEPTIYKPEPRLKITVNNQEKEVFMSGGLIRQLMPIAGGLTDFADVYADVEVQNALIVEALRPRDKRGAAYANVTVDDYEMTIEDTDKLVGWIMEHVLYFFVNSLTSAKSLADKNQGTMEAVQKLTQLQTGSPALPQTKQSAGDSAATPAM